MAAKDYDLMLTGFTNSVWIGKKLKTPGVMSGDRKKIEKSDFLNLVLSWAKGEIKEGDKTLTITQEGKPFAEITFL